MTSQKPILLPFFAIALFGLTACQHLPTNPHTATNTPLIQPFSQPSPLTRIAQPHASTQNTMTAQSGYYPLVTNRQAASSRHALTRLATQTIDVQYYIWHNDEAGQRLLKDLYDSANRGVKVRLLLDDLNSNRKLDQQLLAFAQHPNVSVRLMNPKAYRKLIPLDYITRLPQIQRRMHNKSMTFDGALSIIGGRNVGNEYLRTDQSNEFADLDVLLAGKVVTDVQASFERFWQSPLAYDIQTLGKPTHKLKNLSAEKQFFTTLDKLPQAFIENSSANNNNSSLAKNLIPAKTASNQAIGNFYTAITSHTLPLRWADIRFISDEPIKLTQQDNPSQHLVYQLRNLVGEPKHELTIISSYFVPSPDGIKQLQALAKRGVKIKILTNSFSATDVEAVHAGYSQSRLALLQAGIELYELKPNAQDFKSLTLTDPKPKLSERIKTSIGNRVVSPFSPNIRAQYAVRRAARLASKQAQSLTAQPEIQTENNPKTPIANQTATKKKPALAHFHSTTSLHTKAFAVDNDKVFIGSYNIDPRSANINTELGVVITDPVLAKEFHQSVGQNILPNAYQVALQPPPQDTRGNQPNKSQKGKHAQDLTWTTINPNVSPAPHTTSHEPNISWLNQAWLWLFAKLPIERYL